MSDEIYDVTLQMRGLYAGSQFEPDGATRTHVLEAITTLEELVRVARRVFGKSHPTSRLFRNTLEDAKAKLAKLDE